MTVQESLGPRPPESIPQDAPIRYRLLIFAGVVLGANLQVLDTTMATVAIAPHPGIALGDPGRDRLGAGRLSHRGRDLHAAYGNADRSIGVAGACS